MRARHVSTGATPMGLVLAGLVLGALLVLGGCAGSDPSGSESPSSASPSGVTTPPTEEPSESVADAGPSLEAELVIDEVGIPREVVRVGEGTLLVSDQVGVVYVVTDGTRREEPFLDLREQVRQPESRRLEQGLVGFALDPDFTDSGQVWTTSTEDVPDGVEVPTDTRQVTVLRRWTADVETLTVDPGSAEVVMVLPSTTITHPAGEIVFDDEGRLYTSLGSDGHSDTAQDPLSLSGTVVRIDPSGSEGDRPYRIPPDNPFADGTQGRPEVYSYGYRNPWRLSWDPEHGLLVGEAMFREKPQQVGQPQPGDDAGYPEVTEACWGESGISAGCRETSSGTPIAPPVLEYPLDTGEILSGVVAVPQEAGTQGAGGLAGTVLVADWRGALLIAEPGEPPWSYAESDLGDILTGQYLWDLDVTDDGSVYALVADTSMNDRGGAVYRITAGG